MIGKHLGMSVDRRQIEIDADEYLAKIMALVDAKVVDREPAPLAIDHEPAPLAIDHEPVAPEESVH